jgi:hypothetical protein
MEKEWSMEPSLKSSRIKNVPVQLKPSPEHSILCILLVHHIILANEIVWNLKF